MKNLNRWKQLYIRIRRERGDISRKKLVNNPPKCRKIEKSQTSTRDFWIRRRSVSDIYKPHYSHIEAHLVVTTVGPNSGSKAQSEISSTYAFFFAGCEKWKVMKEGKKKKSESSIGVSNDDSISALGAFSVYLITGLFLAVGFWVVRNRCSVDLVSDPSLTLRIISVLPLHFFFLFIPVFLCCLKSGISLKWAIVFDVWFLFSEYWVHGCGNHIQLVPENPREMFCECGLLLISCDLSVILKCWIFLLSLFCFV